MGEPPTCSTCSNLLDAYDSAVRDYSVITRSLSGMLGDDLTMMYERADKLWLACQDAHQRFMDHWRQNHADVTGQQS
jgi:hypothetical protein